MCEQAKQDFPPFTALKSFAHPHSEPWNVSFYNVFHITKSHMTTSIPSLQISFRACFEGLQETTWIKRMLEVSRNHANKCLAVWPVLLIPLWRTTKPEAAQILPQCLCHPSVAKSSKVYTKLAHSKHMAIILTNCCIYSPSDSILIHHTQLMKQPSSAQVLWRTQSSMTLSVPQLSLVRTHSSIPTCTSVPFMLMRNTFLEK